MSRQANTTMIGAFVLGAIAIVVMGLAFFSDGLLFSDREEYVMFFDRSVQGLEVGAPMKLRGVSIGEVTRIESYLTQDDLNIVNAVYVSVKGNELRSDGDYDPDELLDNLIVKHGMRAQLRIQSLLTGLLYIEVDFKGPEAEMKLWGLVAGVKELPTATTEIEELSQLANNFDFDALSTSMRSITENLDALIADPETQALPKNMNKSLDAVTHLANDMNQVLTRDVKVAVAQINELATNLNADYPAVADDLRQSMASLQAAFGKLEQTMADANHLLSDDSPVVYEVVQTLEQLGTAAKKISTLAATLEREPESLLKGKSAR